MFVSETLVNSAMVNIFNEMLATSRVGGSAWRTACVTVGLLAVVCSLSMPSSPSVR